MTSPRVLLGASNLRPRKQLGQNFLSDPSTAEMIVSRADILPDDIALEIGAGLGALTIPLARSAHTVYSIEKDHKLIELLKTELLVHNVSNVILLETDILKYDFLNLAEKENSRLVIMGNLPYNISSQILVRMLKERKAIKRAVLMVQKELAQRLLARPGNKTYGRITAMLGYCAVSKKLADVRASLFYPKPRVDSEVLEIEFITRSSPVSDDEDYLFSVIKAAFGQRRKKLKNSLAGSELGIDVNTAVSALNFAEIDPGRRAETLSVEEFIILSNCLQKSVFNQPPPPA